MRDFPSRRLLLLCMLWMALGARADTPTPPAGFWNYMAEFSDQDGEVFDPIDLREAQKAAHIKTATAKQTSKSAQAKPREEQQP